jgi:predicted porin
LKPRPSAARRTGQQGTVLSNSSLGANANVTVYGKIDLFTEYNSGGGKGDRLSLESGGLNGTRLGVKGGADITDGVRGVFQLESGIFLNKGTLAQGGRLLGRQAFAGIEGKYGRLTAGRQYSPLYNAVINYDAYEQGYGSPTTDGNVSTGSTRFDNALVYASPKFQGLSANVMLALGGETGKSSDAVALAVNYENGPFDMSVAYQDDDHASSTTAKTENAFIGVGYQIMKTKLLAGYGHAVTTPDGGLKTTRNEWMVGSRTAVTGTGKLLLSYGEGKTENSNPENKAASPPSAGLKASAPNPPSPSSPPTRTAPARPGPDGHQFGQQLHGQSGRFSIRAGVGVSVLVLSKLPGAAIAVPGRRSRNRKQSTVYR